MKRIMLILTFAILSSSYFAVNANSADVDEGELAEARPFIESAVDYAANIKNCTPFSGKFPHPFMGGEMSREIYGVKSLKSGEEVCLYQESVPGDMHMGCAFPIDKLEIISNDIIASLGEEVEGSEEAVENFYMDSLSAKGLTDIETSSDVLSELMDNGTCKIRTPDGTVLH